MTKGKVMIMKIIMKKHFRALYGETLENGKLYQQKEYEDFNYNLKTPTKGFIKVGRDDGSTDTYDVDFRVNMSLNEAKHTPPTKKQNNNNNNQDIDIEKLYNEGLFGNN